MSSILIVDDEHEVRNILVRLLSTHGYEVDAVPSAEEALEQVAAQEPDLVLTDLMMPGMSGEDLIRELRRDHAGVSIIVMTSYPSVDSAVQAVRARVDDYLRKPFDELDDVAHCVRRALERRRLQEENARLIRELEEKNRLLDGAAASLQEKVEEAEADLTTKIKRLEATHAIISTQHDRMVTIVNTIEDALVVTDPQFDTILLNPAAEKLLGVPSFKVLGKNLLKSPGNAGVLSHLEEAHRAALDGRRTSHEIGVEDGEGEPLYYSMFTTPVCSRANEVVGVLTTARDITKRKAMDEMKNRFLSIVAHELRTPLAGIKAFSAMLAKEALGTLNDQQRNAATEIKRQSDRLEDQVDKIICVGRLERSDFEPDFQEFSVQSVVRSVLRYFEAEAEKKQVAIDVDVHDATLNADKEDAKRALRALVDNAIKFTQEGGRVSVTGVPENGQLKIAVRDTGIGIDPKHHRTIFETFTQLENPLTRQFGGAGLGLSVARNIVRAHGGDIDVESQVNKGSTFRFALPLASNGSQQDE